MPKMLYKTGASDVCAKLHRGRATQNYTRRLIFRTLKSIGGQSVYRKLKKKKKGQYDLIFITIDAKIL